MPQDRKNILINFKKAKSLTEKLIIMTENGDYCIDIMQQNLAVIGLLKSAHQMMMANHLTTCFKAAMESMLQLIQLLHCAKYQRYNERIDAYP